MAPCYKFGQCTITGKFKSSSKEYIQSKLWDGKQLKKRIPGAVRNNNFIKLAFDRGVIAMIYNQGGFFLIITQTDFESVISQLPQIINFLKDRYVTLLFENEITSSSYRICQFFFTIYPNLKVSNVLLTVETLTTCFASQRKINTISIPFEDLTYNWRIDFAAQENGPNNFYFKAFFAGEEIAAITVKNSFIATVIAKNIKHLFKLYLTTAEFLIFLQNKAISLN